MTVLVANPNKNWLFHANTKSKKLKVKLAYHKRYYNRNLKLYMLIYLKRTKNRKLFLKTFFQLFQRGSQSKKLTFLSSSVWQVQ